MARTSEPFSGPFFPHFPGDAKFQFSPFAFPGPRGCNFVRDKFLHRGFCTSETRIWARILPNEFWTPEFRPNSWVEFFGPIFSRKRGPLQNSPSRNSPPKFTFQSSTQKSGQKIHIAPLQGHLAETLGTFSRHSGSEREGVNLCVCVCSLGCLVRGGGCNLVSPYLFVLVLEVEDSPPI